MSRNNTGNPIGSKAFPDFEDNVKNLDEAVNTADPQWVDRFGRFRLPLMEQERQFVSDQERREGEFQADQSSREAVFSDFLQASGYQDLGEYAPGIEITAHNQYVTFGGQPYLLKPSIPVPYTTSGEWTGDDFKLIGDAVLRQDLANPDMGARLVRGAVIYVSTIADLQALDTSGLVDGQMVQVKEYHDGTDVGGGEFYWDAASTESDNGGTVFSAHSEDNGRWLRNNLGFVDIYSFGAKGDGISDDTFPLRGLIQLAIDDQKLAFIPPGNYLIGTGNEFTIPQGKGLKIIGAGRSSLLKMKDGAVTSRFARLFSFSGEGVEGDLSSVHIENIRVDHNATNSPIPDGESAYFFEQAHTFRIAGVNIKAYFKNVDVSDPVADVFNCSTPSCHSYSVIDCGVTNRNRSRIDVQFSYLPKVSRVINFNGVSIGPETLSGNSFGEAHMVISNCKVDSLNMQLGGTVGIVSISDTVSSRVTYISGRQVLYKINNCTLFMGMVNARNFSCGDIGKPSCSVSNTTLILPSELGVHSSCEIDKGNVIFDNCEFVIDSEEPSFDSGACISAAVSSSSTLDREVVFKNCSFDPRARASIIAERAGKFVIDNCNLSGSSVGVACGAVASGGYSDVTIKDCNFSNVTGNGIRINRAPGSLNKLTLLGQHIGEAAGKFAIDTPTGFTENVDLVSNREVILTHANRELPDTGNRFALVGDTIKRVVALDGSSVGEPSSWRRVRHGTASGNYAVASQNGLFNYTQLPAAFNYEPGWQILYNNALTTWDGSNWRLPDGTAAT